MRRVLRDRSTDAESGGAGQHEACSSNADSRAGRAGWSPPSTPGSLRSIDRAVCRRRKPRLRAVILVVVGFRESEKKRRKSRRGYLAVVVGAAQGQVGRALLLFGLHMICHMDSFPSPAALDQPGAVRLCASVPCPPHARLHRRGGPMHVPLAVLLVAARWAVPMRQPPWPMRAGPSNGVSIDS